MSEETRILFLDLETTGLDTARDSILEVGAILVDLDLTPLARFSSLVGHNVCCPGHLFANRARDGAPGGLVLAMHAASHLLDEAAERWTTLPSLEEVESRLLMWLTNERVGRREMEVAGYSIHFDRKFIARQMPELEAFLSHRMIDVSSLRALHRRWVGPLPQTEKAHRAIADCEQAIEELRSYRVLFPPSASTDVRSQVTVYVCGASQQIERAERMIARLRVIPGVVVSFDWPRLMRAEARPDSEVGIDRLRSIFREELSCARNADVLVFLHPDQGAQTVVGWAELGAAMIGTGTRRPSIVVSRHTDEPTGELEALHPFAGAACDVVVSHDEAAIAWVVGRIARAST